MCVTRGFRNTLALAAGLIAGAAPLPAADAWVRVECRDVILLSDAPPKDAVEIAVGYSAFRQAVGELLLPAGRRTPPTQLVLFRRTQTMHQYCVDARDPDAELLFYSAEVDGNPLIAFSLAGDRRDALDKAYELGARSDLSRAGFFLPLWMAKGAGEVLSTLRFENGRCVVGKSDERFTTPLLRQSWLSWGQFSRVDIDSPEYLGQRKRGVYPGQAWALMHWVLLGEPTGARERFAALAAQAQATTDADAAVAAIMHRERAAVQDEVWRHLRREVQITLPVDEGALRSQTQVAPAPEAEVDVQLANLLRACGQSREADTQLERARTLAPDLPAVKEAIARRELAQDNRTGAVEFYRQAIAAGSVDARAFLLSAETRLNDARSNGRDEVGDGGPAADKALAEIRRAIALDPGNDDAYRLLGRALFVAARVTAANLDELAPGLTSPALGPTVRCYRGLLLQRLARTDEALADYQQVLAATGADGRVQRLAKVQAEGIRFDQIRVEVEQKTQAGDFAAAFQRLDAVPAADLERATVTRYQGLRSAVEEQAAYAEVLRRHQAGPAAEFQQAAADFLQKYPRSPLLKKVRDLQHTPPPAPAGS